MMKIIFIKNYSKWKKNEITEVSDGYAVNFLIPKSFAVPHNKKTLLILNKNISKQKKQKEIELRDINKLKEVIEKLNLEFKIKSNDNTFHGQISKKQIVEKLKTKNIIINSFSIENFKITKYGITNVKINLSKDISALLKLEIINEK